MIAVVVKLRFQIIKHQLVILVHSVRQKIFKEMKKTSINVLPSKNQALCEYYTLVSKFKHC